ncbi:hypothetical protein O5D80_002090 [Batrachochytrium dendrobatidis]|nr:hypothetical protein O5D80_002090 [Batrachochytrium dendrobatidis]
MSRRSAKSKALSAKAKSSASNNDSTHDTINVSKSSNAPVLPLKEPKTNTIEPVIATDKPKSKTQKKRKNDATEPEKSDNVLVQDQTDVVKPQVDATDKPKSKTQKKRKITDASPVSDQPCKNLLENAHTSESPVDTDAKTKGSAIATSNKENSKKSSVSKKTKESKTSSTGASKLSKTTLAKNDTTSAKKSTASLPTTCLAPITSTNKWENATLCGDAARKEKFMRLLGAKKTGVSTTNVPTSDLSHDTESTQESLLKQFEKSKDIQQTRKQGKRLGLGF